MRHRGAAVKAIYFLFLLAFVGVLGLFAYRNSGPIEIGFWDTSFQSRTWELPLPAVFAAVYLLGMLTGWTVVGLLRRSWRNVAEDVR